MIRWGVNILAVEDDEGFVALLRALLRGRHRVDDVPTMAQAREKLKIASYDVALVDLTLPDSSRADTWLELPALQRDNPRTRFVVVTGSSEIRSTATVQVVYKMPEIGFAEALTRALGVA